MRPRREIQEINAGSMADIAFLLLIFFLVTTTMDTDKGLLRVLPPETNDSPPKIHNRNVLNILINRGNHILVNTEQLRIQDIRLKTVEFLLNEANDKNLPEKN